MSSGARSREIATALLSSFQVFVHGDYTFFHTGTHTGKQQGMEKWSKISSLRKESLSLLQMLFYERTHTATTTTIEQVQRWPLGLRFNCPDVGDYLQRRRGMKIATFRTRAKDKALPRVCHFPCRSRVCLEYCAAFFHRRTVASIVSLASSQSSRRGKCPAFFAAAAA